MNGSTQLALKLRPALDVLLDQTLHAHGVTTWLTHLNHSVSLELKISVLRTINLRLILLAVPSVDLLTNVQEEELASVTKHVNVTTNTGQLTANA